MATNSKTRTSSNNQMISSNGSSGNARRKFSEYRKETKPEPFILVDDDGNDIVIPVPDTEVMLDLSEVPQNELRRILRTMCQDQYEAVYELVRHEPFDVLNELVYDMLTHFGYDPSQTVPGGTGASSS